jgi:hypothetical protein
LEAFDLDIFPDPKDIADLPDPDPEILTELDAMDEVESLVHVELFFYNNVVF